METVIKYATIAKFEVGQDVESALYDGKMRVVSRWIDSDGLWMYSLALITKQNKINVKSYTKRFKENDLR